VGRCGFWNIIQGSWIETLDNIALEYTLIEKGSAYSDYVGRLWIQRNCLQWQLRLWRKSWYADRRAQILRTTYGQTVDHVKCLDYSDALHSIQRKAPIWLNLSKQLLQNRRNHPPSYCSAQLQDETQSVFFPSMLDMSLQESGKKDELLKC
jgi:hypothetical protein